MMMRPSLAVAAVVVAVSVAVFWTTRNGEGTFSIDPHQLDFGEIAVGDQRRLSVVATNLGSVPLSLRKVEAKGPFALSHSGLTLEPGQSRGLVVTYAPTEAGPSEGRLTLASDALRRSVAMKGSAVHSASIQVDPLHIAFGEVAIDGEAKGIVNITNSGGSDLEIEALATGQPFQPALPSLVVAPGERRVVEVAFRPQAPGDFEKSLTIRSNDPKKTSVTVHMDGTGVASASTAAIQVDPGALEFGSVSTCAPERRWVAIRNAGSDPLTITGMQIAAPFSAPARSRRIDAGGELRVPVSFSPAQEGGRAASLGIYSNDPSRGVVEVDLSGVGRACAPGDETRRAEAEAARAPVFAGLRSAARSTGGVKPGTGEASTEGGEPADGAGSSAALEGTVAGGSSLRLASYSSDISDFHIDAVGFDPGSGSLSLQGLRLPVVEAALGEFFMFSPTEGAGRVDELGETVIQLPFELLDPDGGPTPLSMTLTTGTSSAVVNDRLVSVTGSPLDSSGKATLVGLMVLPSQTGFGGDSMRIVLNVQIR